MFGEREKFLRSHKCDLMLIVPQAYVDSLRKNCLQLSLAEGPVRRSDLSVPQLDKGYTAYINWKRLFSCGTLTVSLTLKHESRTVATVKFVTFSSRSMIITSLTRVQLLLYRIKDRGEGGLGAIGRV